MLFQLGDYDDEGCYDFDFISEDYEDWFCYCESYEYFFVVVLLDCGSVVGLSEMVLYIYWMLLFVLLEFYQGCGGGDE